MRAARLILTTLLLISLASIANAQATRTWVSGVGDDVNPCSRTAPCKTFAGAISKTAKDGLINVLDPGGFGAVTIVKSITIDGTPFMAGVLASGTNGININITDVNDVNKQVTLRGLDIEGAGTGLIGVSISSANKVVIENCRILGFRAGSARGISVNTTVANMQLMVRNTTITGNGAQGIAVTGGAGGATQLHVTNSEISQNGSSAVDLLANAKATINRCNFVENGSAGVFAEATSTDADVAFTAMEHNIIGVSALASATVRLYNSHITHNSTSVSGSVSSHNNNGIINNNVNTLPAGIGQQ